MTSLLDRVLRAHRAVEDGHDEETAVAKLGYVLRPDHPWRGLTTNTTRGVEPDGSCVELECSDAHVTG